MATDARPFISIITLNYNQTGFTCNFIESAKHLTYQNFEILVCDMASVDDPTDRINALQFEKVRVLRSETNLGFAGGNNWGMKQAKGTYFFIVNNDTILTPDILDKLIYPFHTDERIGVTCPKIKYIDRPDTIEYAGFNKMNPFTGRVSAIGYHQKDDGRFDISHATTGAHGCAMMIKREVAQQTGFFAEEFFLYYEEWDWSARIIKAGYTIWYTADATIFHKGSASMTGATAQKVYYLTRNRILYMRKNSNWFQFFVFVSFFTVFTIPKTIIGYLAKGQYAFLESFFKGIGWNLVSPIKSGRKEI